MITRRGLLTYLSVGATLAGVGLLVKNANDNAANDTIARLGENNIPNVPLITHKGERLHFYDDIARNNIVVMNMMYTSCTGICPLATANLIQVNRLLTAKWGARFAMCSLSLQPEIDDAAMLQFYVNQHGIPDNWTYLTGKRQHVDLLRVALGFYDIDPEVDGDSASHTGMLRLGNEQVGRWSMMPSQANPDQIVNAIEHLARYS